MKINKTISLDRHDCLQNLKVWSKEFVTIELAIYWPRNLNLTFYISSCYSYYFHDWSENTWKRWHVASLSDTLILRYLMLEFIIEQLDSNDNNVTTSQPTIIPLKQERRKVLIEKIKKISLKLFLCKIARIVVVCILHLFIQKIMTISLVL